MEDISFFNLSDDELDQLVTRIEASVSAMRTLQMQGLREIDRRQTPLADGCRSLVEWVTGRLDVAPDTAKELVATARRLDSAPTVEAAALVGDISFDRTAAGSRLAAHDAEGTVLAESAGLDVAGIHRQVALRRRMTRGQEHAGFRDQYVATQSNLDHTALDFHGRMVGVAGRVFRDALHAVGDQLPEAPNARSRGSRNADALWKMSQDALNGGGEGAAATHGVTVFVDATDAAATNGEAGVVIEAGPRVGPETLEAMICSASIEVLATTEGGNPLGVGRRSRVVSPKLRRFVLHRDGRNVRRGRLHLSVPPRGPPHRPVEPGRGDRRRQPHHAVLVPPPCCGSRRRFHHRSRFAPLSAAIPPTERPRPSLIVPRSNGEANHPQPAKR